MSVVWGHCCSELCPTLYAILWHYLSSSLIKSPLLSFLPLLGPTRKKFCLGKHLFYHSRPDQEHLSVANLGITSTHWALFCITKWTQNAQGGVILEKDNMLQYLPFSLWDCISLSLQQNCSKCFALQISSIVPHYLFW